MAGSGRQMGFAELSPNIRFRAAFRCLLLAQGSLLAAVSAKRRESIIRL